MREILFRGKAKNQNEFYHFSNVWRDCLKDGFVLGSLIVSGNRYYICVSTIGANKSAINNGTVSMIEVIPETVGQYTGLTDKNGNKIFEGDIVEFYIEDVRIVGKVFYSKDATAFEVWYELPESRLLLLSKTLCDFEYIKVIGNIHDNPELLKEADNE